MKRWKSLSTEDKNFIGRFLAGAEGEKIEKRLEQENGRVNVIFEGYLGLYHPRDDDTGFGAFNTPYAFAFNAG